MKKTKNDMPVAAMLSVLLMFITYFFTQHELEGLLTDYAGHVYTYIPLLRGSSGVDGWMAVPYFLWHMCVMLLEQFTPVPLEAAAAFVSCFFTALSFYVLYWMFDRVVVFYGLPYGEGTKSFFAFALCIVQPIYMYWFDATSQYLGQFSINPMHNPTHMCVKPFSLLCLCFTYDILEWFHDPDHKGIFVDMTKKPHRAYVLLAVTLFLSCMAKPTFAEMFIPTAGLLMLYEWIKRICAKNNTAAEYFQKCLTMLLISVPSLLYILLQFLAYFIWGGSYGADGEGLIITAWMQVWHIFSENVAASMLLGMAFPFFIVLINAGWFVRDTLGRLALTGYIVGLLECALLAEGGGKSTHGDFLWPMMSGMTLLWVVSTIRFLILQYKQNQTKKQQLCIQTGWTFLFVHMAFGIIYLCSYMTEVY